MKRYFHLPNDNPSNKRVVVFDHRDDGYTGRSYWKNGDIPASTTIWWLREMEDKQQFTEITREKAERLVGAHRLPNYLFSPANPKKTVQDLIAALEKI